MVTKYSYGDWRDDVRRLDNVEIVDVTGPYLTDADWKDATAENAIQEILGALHDAQRAGQTHVLFVHGESRYMEDEISRGDLVREVVLFIQSWCLVWRSKSVVYRDALLAAIRPPLSDAEEAYYQKLAKRIWYPACHKAMTTTSSLTPQIRVGDSAI